MTAIIDQSTMQAAGSTLSLNGSTSKVGVQTSTPQLQSVSSLSGVAGVSVSNGTVTITKAGLVLEGYDLRGSSVVVKANDVVIKDCLAAPSSTGRYGIYQEQG